MTDPIKRVHKKIKKAAYNHDKLLDASIEYLDKQTGLELMNKAASTHEQIENILAESRLPGTILLGILHCCISSVSQDYKNEKKLLDTIEHMKQYVDENFQRKENWRGKPK